MKNDYTNGATLERYAIPVNSPAFMPFRQITSPSNQQGSTLSRTYNRNPEYSTLRRNNYLHNAIGNDSNSGAATTIRPTAVPSNSSSIQNQPQHTVANFSRPNFTNTGSSARKTSHGANKRLPLSGVALLVFTIAVLALAGLVFKSGSQSPFSKQLASTVSIKLYYPTKIPSGYHMANSSIKMATSESMQFKITNGKNVILVNESPAESGPDIARVLQTNFQKTSPISSSYGNALVGYQKNSQGIFGSLVSKDGSWIVATSNSDRTSADMISDIISSLRPI